jgi:hypothetical protein
MNRRRFLQSPLAAAAPSLAQTTATPSERIRVGIIGCGGILPLADFGTSLFGECYTGVADTADATVSGTSGPIGQARS